MSCKVNVWFRKVYRYLKHLFEKIKKDINLQFVVLCLAIGLFIWLSWWHPNSNYRLLSATINLYRLIFIVLIGVCALPLAINLLLQAFSEGEKYDETVYSLVFKEMVHIAITAVIVMSLVFFWGLLYALLLFILPSLSSSLSLLLSGIIILWSMFIIDALLTKYFNLPLWNFFIHSKKINLATLI